MCNDTFSKILAFIGALVLGVITAVLHYVRVITDVRTLLYVGLGLAALMLVYVLSLLFGNERARRCLCRYASTLLYASLLTVLVSAVLLSIIVSESLILDTILLGVWATLLFFALIVLCMLVSCFISAQCNSCNTGGDAHCSNGACRF